MKVVNRVYDNPMKRPPHYIAYIYLIKCNEFYKIGVSQNVIARVSTIQTGNPYKVKLIFAVLTPFADKMEKAFHNKFAASRTQGEWFILSEDDLVEAYKGFVKVEDLVKEGFWFE